MAGLGLGPADFKLFEIDDPRLRAVALEGTLQPKLEAIGAQCLGGLSRLSGRPLHAHRAGLASRRGQPPGEVLVAICDTPRGWRGVPYLGVAVTRAHLHARIGVRGESPRWAAMAEALLREASNLARKGKPFRKLRHFVGWDYEELPELAPAHSTAFWVELSEGLATGGPGFDVGVAFGSEETRSLALGDLLGVFRDLAPLYKVLAAASERAVERPRQIGRGGGVIPRGEGDLAARPTGGGRSITGGSRMAVKVMVAPANVRVAESKPVAPRRAGPSGESVRPKRRRSSIYDADGNEVFITLMCLKCHQMRPLSQFGLRKMADGAIRNQPWCRACRSAAGTGKGRIKESTDIVESTETVDSMALLRDPPAALLEAERPPVRDGQLADQIAAALAAGLGR
jgi:hypothetical protein